MFKQGDNVSFQKIEHVSQEGVNELDRIDIPDKKVVIKGVIAPLTVFYIPVKLASGEIRHKHYSDLKFLKGEKVSFRDRKPDWKGIKDGKEVVIRGKSFTVRGEAVLRDLHIPVLVDGELCQIPYQELKFEKEQK